MLQLDNTDMGTMGKVSRPTPYDRRYLLTDAF